MNKQVDQLHKVSYFIGHWPMVHRKTWGETCVETDGKDGSADCMRKMRKTDGGTLRPGAVSADDPQRCFLSQGVICLGSVTLNRCLSPCPQKGITCSGSEGQSVDMVQRLGIQLARHVRRFMRQ